MSRLLVKSEPYRTQDGLWSLIKVGDRYSVVDYDDYNRLKRFCWRLRKSNACWYAVRRKKIDGKTIEIKMHREIMDTPEGMDCHHIDHDSLNNQKYNLWNLTPKEHQTIHGRS